MVDPSFVQSVGRLMRRDIAYSVDFAIDTYMTVGVDVRPCVAAGGKYTIARSDATFIRQVSVQSAQREEKGWVRRKVGHPYKVFHPEIIDPACDDQASYSLRSHSKSFLESNGPPACVSLCRI